MKKLLSIFLCFMLLFSLSSCKKKNDEALRVWCLQPSSSSVEQELRNMIAGYDPNALVAFVPADELGMRLDAAFEKGEAPDVTMLYTDAIADLAEKKAVLDLSNRLPLSRVETDKLSDAALRACLYQGKTYGVPLFCDVYMLATNRAAVAIPPESFEQLKARCLSLKEKGIGSFDKLSPAKKSLLYEAALYSCGGEMLNSRKTKLEFTSQKGEKALGDCVEVLGSASDETDSLGAGKAAFSVLTMSERLAMSEKFPDAEIALSPLFGLDRLQTVALAASGEAQNQAEAFKMIEFLQGNADKLSALYRVYSADKNIKPRAPEDEDAVQRLSSARPAPDLCGYESLTVTYLPAALEKAGKGVDAATALGEAAAEASENIWRGKRE